MTATLIPGVGSTSLRVARKYALAAPGVNTNMLATGVVPKATGSAFRVTVSLTTASVFNVHMTDGTTAYVIGLNASVALQAGDLYTFTFSADPLLTYNFQVETDGVIRTLIVDEIVGGAL